MEMVKWVLIALLAAVGTLLFVEKATEVLAPPEQDTAVMRRINEINGITNMDSSIAKAKRMRPDSLNMILFNMYATDGEREMVKKFALLIKSITNSQK